jgi:hypothetical protein
MAARSLRRLVLAAGLVGLCALVARRAHALRDPETLSGGVSYGEHDAHLTCGPDVRVRHASAGVHYDRVFQHPDYSPGVGVIADARFGGGGATISKVYPSNAAGTPSSDELALAANEHGQWHGFGGGQVMAGWDFGVFSARAGIGVFGFGTEDGNRIRQSYSPWPALELRIGRRTGFSSDLGLGALPIPGLARSPGLYALAQHRWEDGGELGVGTFATFGDFDARRAVLVKGAYPVSKALLVGAFGSVESGGQQFHQVGFGGGVGVTVLLDR